MIAAAVVTAGVTSLAVLMAMVVTVNIGIVAQISAEQCAHRRVGVPADTAVELDARFGQSCLRTAADAVVSPSDVQRLPVDKTRCDLAPCAFVNLLHGRAGNVHLRGTLLVGLLLQVNQPNDLVLVQRQQDRLGILVPVGAECIKLWCTTIRWHRGGLGMDTSSFVFRYIPIIQHIQRILNKK